MGCKCVKKEQDLNNLNTSPTNKEKYNKKASIDNAKYVFFKINFL